MTARPTEAQRLRRCLAMAFLLAEQGVDRAGLAETFGVSERRITHDLALLRAAGVRVFHRRGIGYRALLPRTITADVAPGVTATRRRG